MNWKTDIQLIDIDLTQRIEATCKQCNHTHYVDVANLIKQPEMQFIYMDELEAMTICKARLCPGHIRLALVHDRDTEGFVGGMA